MPQATWCSTTPTAIPVPSTNWCFKHTTRSTDAEPRFTARLVPARTPTRPAGTARCWPPDEKAACEQMAALYTLGSGKAEMMVTRPQTLGYSLADSPAGLAAWFYDKFADWTYSDGDPERSLTKDEMLDDISLYWFTGTRHPSARLYGENNASNFNAVDIWMAAAVTVFPGEIYRALRSWCERAYHKLVSCHQP